MKRPALLGRADLALILLALGAAAVWLLWPRADACTAVVEQDGVELARVDLSSLAEEKVLNLGGPYRVRLRAGPGFIEFLSSDCPDQVCVRTGRLTRAGETAVCLPARISVRLEGGAGGGTDAVTG